jgi:uncharacterized protein
MELYKQSKYAHVYPSVDGGLAFFNSRTLELLEGGSTDHAVWRSFERPRPLRSAEPAASVPAVAGAQDQRAVVEHALVDAGLLVPADRPERRELLDRLTAVRLAQRRTRTSRFSFLRISLTEKCNLACDYCFVEEVIYKDAAKPAMTEERFRENIEWLISQNPGGNPSVQYFGGEPMLRMDLMEVATQMFNEAVAEGRIQGYTHTMTTNGTLMTPERARWLVENNVELTFSLDGWRELNDQHRLFHNGRSSFDLVMGAMDQVRAAGGDFAVLITLRPDTVPLLPQITRYAVDELSCKNVEVNSPQPTADGWEVDGLELSRAIQESWLYCNSQGVEFHSLGAFIVESINARRPQPDRCFDNSPSRREAEWGGYVSADGKLSFCIVWHQDDRVTTPSVREIPKPRAEEWHYNTHTDDACDGCVAGMICGGPCTLERLFNGGGLNPDRCKFFKSMVPFVLSQPSLGGER